MRRPHLAVLRGAERTLRAHHPVLLLEHGYGSADYYGTGPDDVHGLLTEFGYSVFALGGTGPLTAVEFAADFASGARVNFLAVSD